MLDAMIASALKKLLDGHVHFRRRASVEEQRAQSTNWDEQFCKELDELASEDHSKTATRAQRNRHGRRLQELRSQDGEENPLIPPNKQ